MKTVALYEAKTHLSALVEATGRGESFVISVRSRPVARLVPITEAPQDDPIARLLANPIAMGMSVREAIDDGRA